MSAPFLFSYLALWVLVILQALILLGLTLAVHELRNGPLMAKRPSPQGQPAPKFSAVDLSGNPVSSELFAGRPTVLLFVSPNCPSCMVTFPELSALASNSERGLFVVCRGTPTQCRKLAVDYDLTLPIVPDEDAELTRIFGVSATPTAVRISAAGVIESYGEPVRADDLAKLVAASALSPEHSLGPSAGE